MTGVPPHHAAHSRRAWWPWLWRFALSFVVLNTLLTLENRWPGLGVRVVPRLSFELCLACGGLMVWMAWQGRITRGAMRITAVVFTFLVAVRYVEVTVPAVFGRPVNLYWDGRHAAEVLRMALMDVPAAQIAAGMAVLLAGVISLHAVVQRTVTTLAVCLAWRAPRPALLAAVAALTTSFAVYPVAQPWMHADTRWFFSLPITPALARQALLLPAALWPETGSKLLPHGPAFDGNLQALHHADVLLLFAESYGACTLDDPLQMQALSGHRARLAEALASSGRQVVSARVRSPTYGGASWLAHAALLSGIDTRDPDRHDLLLTTNRPTLVSHFARHGWRTVGWMPGLQKPWPEGRFYGFDRLAGAEGIGYLGRRFGYWGIPDQASMALLHEQELQADPGRAPRFIVFPTLATHAPFHPLPPYLSEGSQATRADAYDTDEASGASEAAPWSNPVPAYLRALGYQFDWLTDYLAHAAPPSMVTIIIGDHQPLATVSGPKASWDVPVHVISDNSALMQRLQAAGFESSMEPRNTAIGGMHELTALLLAAFSQPKQTVLP